MKSVYDYKNVNAYKINIVSLRAKNVKWLGFLSLRNVFIILFLSSD